MKATIEVASRKEAELIRAALEDDVNRAAIVVIGALHRIKSPRAKRRILQFVREHFEERENE
jgi:hypothetical protein